MFSVGLSHKTFYSLLPGCFKIHLTVILISQAGKTEKQDVSKIQAAPLTSLNHLVIGYDDSGPAPGCKLGRSLSSVLRLESVSADLPHLLVAG